MRLVVSLCLFVCILHLSLSVFPPPHELVRQVVQHIQKGNLRDIKNYFNSIGGLSDSEKQELEALVGASNVQLVGGFYDVVVSATSLKGLKDGWKVVFNSPAIREKYSKKFPTTIIGFTGIYDAGKTFILNEYINGVLPSGVQVETVGLSMKTHDNLMWLDSAGIKRAVSNERLEDRLATDHFITKMVLHMSDVVIYVVNGLFVTDIHHINGVYEKLLQISPTKRLIVVHNFVNYWTQEEVQKHIKDDIIEAFAATHDTVKYSTQGNADNKQCDRYLSHNGKVLHVVLAKKGSVAGNMYNPCGMSLLRRVIEGVMTQNEVDVFDTITRNIQNLLPRYFFLPGQSNEIPLVLDTVGVSISKDGSRSVFTPWDRIVSMLQKAKETVTALAGFFNRPGNEITINPFAISMEKAEDHNLIKLEKPFNLDYMPFNGNTHPDVAYKPHHEVFLDDSRIVIVVDLPGVSFHETGCANAVTLVIRGVRVMDESLKSLTRVKTPNNRRYGTFSITIPLPQNVVCQELRNLGKLDKGVFKIDYTWQDCEDGFCSSAPAAKPQTETE